MNRFWSPIIEPVLEVLKPKAIVEIGSDRGDNTRNLLEFCKRNGATLHAIDPLPNFNVAEWQEQYGGHLVFHQALSLNALDKIPRFDIVLIDGDHNWYTVFNELKLIEKRCEQLSQPFPLIMLHDIGWPYGRRDLYYNPENIPEAYRKPYKQKGMRPGSAELIEEGGLNPHLFNVIYENILQSGVLTAIEDFLKETKLSIELVKVPGFHGLGVLIPLKIKEQNKDIEKFFSVFQLPPILARHIERIERAWLEWEIGRQEHNTALKKLEAKRKEEVGNLQDSLQKLTTELQAKETEVADIRQRLEDADRTLTEKDKQIQAKETEIADIKQKLEDADRAVLEKENKLLSVKTELQKRNKDVETLIHWLEKLDHGISELLKSWRWKVGNSLGEIRRRLLFQRPVPMASDLIVDTFRIFHAWKKNFKEFNSQCNGLTTLRTLSPLIPVQSSDSLSAESTYAPFAVKSPRVSGFDLSPQRKLAKQPSFLSGRWDHSSIERIISMSEALRKITVIIPIFNAHNDVVKCLNSVRQNTNKDVCILLINDCSTDDRIGPLLREFSMYENVKVLHNPNNMGFVRTVNRGLEQCQGDVIILNSDTVVGPRWIEKLFLCAYFSDDVATVTAISNAAGAFSFPEIGVENSVPLWLTHDEVSRIISKESMKSYPECPTGNGFCMYIRRDVIDQIGLFDEERFQQGYGEENDFCLRARKVGWRHLIDDSNFVFHKRSASYGIEKQNLMKKTRKVVDFLHPEYTSLVREFVNSRRLKALRDAAKRSFENARLGSVDGRPRLLYVLHQGSGGTPATTHDLMSGVQIDYECFVLTSNSREIFLYWFDETSGKARLLNKWNLSKPWRITDLRNDEFKHIYFNVLVGLDIEIVHVRHLICHTFDLPDLCKMLGIPAILSFHDFYFVCPSINLLDDQDKYCGGGCTETGDQCRIPTAWLSGLPVLKKGWLETWRNTVSEALNLFNAFVTTSQSSYEIIVNTYPFLREMDFRVIEHGRDLEQASGIAAMPCPGEKIRILVPGNLGFHKGTAFIRSLAEYDSEHNNILEFHFLGRVPEEMASVGIIWGPYRRDEFVEKVAKISPSFIGVFSVGSETYCHTLTEAWASGVPVLVSDFGTLRERLDNHGGGWTISVTDPKAAYKRILEIINNPDEYIHQRKLASIKGLSTVADMCRDYLRFYLDVRERQRRQIQGNKSTSVELLFARVPRIGVLVPSSTGGFPGSSYIRVLNQITHPTARQLAHFELMGSEQALVALNKRQVDVILVQRTAVEQTNVNQLIEACNKASVPIVYELDDNLLATASMKEFSKEYALKITMIKQFLRAAKVVTVSTKKLGDSLQEFNPNINVVPNYISEKVWFKCRNGWEDPEEILQRASLKKSEYLKIVYIGTYTHRKNLAIISNVLKRAVEELGVKVVLIGVQNPKMDSSFFDRIIVPDSCKNYPMFVQWLKEISDWDIGVAPLDRTLLSEGKSYLKYLEYACLGLPGIYSSKSVYEDIVVDGRTGLLSENTEDAWWAVLRRLIENPELRDEIRINALKDVVDSHLLRSGILTWIQPLLNVTWYQWIPCITGKSIDYNGY